MKWGKYKRIITDYRVLPLYYTSIVIVLGDLLVHWLCVGFVLVNLVDLREECLRELVQFAEKHAVGL
jgi:hypothetical protein